MEFASLGFVAKFSSSNKFLIRGSCFKRLRILGANSEGRT
jgi:hypothetical protein